MIFAYGCENNELRNSNSRPGKADSSCSKVKEEKLKSESLVQNKVDFDKGNYEKTSPKDLVLLLHKTNKIQTEDAAPGSVSAHTEGTGPHVVLPKLSTKPPLWILLSMPTGSFGESSRCTSNQNANFQNARREKDMDLMKHEIWFLCAFVFYLFFCSFGKELHPKKLTSHQFWCEKGRQNSTKRGQNRRILAVRENTDEIQFPDCRMPFKLRDSTVAEVFRQSPQPFHQLQLQQQFPQAE